MRIALVTGRFMVGGVETFLTRLARGLALHGDTVSFVATETTGPAWEDLRAAGYETQAALPSLAHSKAWWCRRAAAVIRSLEPEVVVLNHAWVAQASAALLGDGPVVMSVVHNEPTYAVRVACANSGTLDAIVAPSPRLFDLALAQGVDRAKLTLIPHGIDAPERIPPRRHGDVVHALYVGRLEEAQKGVFLLPEIVQLARQQGVDVTLDVIGSGPDEAALREHVTRAGLDGVISFLGMRPNEEVLRRLSEADVLLMPSRWEGLPILLLEAMGAGCLVVVSRLPGITEWALENGRAGYLAEAGNARTFAEALSMIRGDIREAEDRRRRAHERCRSLFSAGRMVDSYVRVVETARTHPVSRMKLPDLSSDLVTWRAYVPAWVRWMAGRPVGWLRPNHRRS